MNLKKVIRIYFYFLVISFSISIGLQDGNLRHNFASVLTAAENFSNEIVFIEDIEVERVSDFVYERADLKNSDSIYIEFKKEGIDTNIHNNEDPIKHIFTNLYIKNLSEDIVLKSLYLNSAGSFAGNIEKLNLIFEDELISSAKRSNGDSFKFENIDFTVLKNAEINLFLEVVFSNMHINDRFRFIIKDEYSLIFSDESKDFSIKQKYPISTPFVSVYR